MRGDRRHTPVIESPGDELPSCSLVNYARLVGHFRAPYVINAGHKVLQVLPPIYKMAAIPQDGPHCQATAEPAPSFSLLSCVSPEYLLFSWEIALRGRDKMCGECSSPAPA